MKLILPTSQGGETYIDVFPLECKGQLVLTTKQLALIFDCTRQNLSTNFNRHINEFIEGVDYFFLHGIELKIFMQRYTGNYGNYGNVARNNFDYMSAFGPQAHALYLWTSDGAFKHSQYLNNKTAIEIYLKYLPVYFNAENPASEPEPQLSPPAQQSLFEDEPAIAQPAPDDKRIEMLMKLIDMVEDGDENTPRNRLILATASLILGRQI